MKIEDLVTMDFEGEFRSDVKLSDFDNPQLNKQLLRNYIFTVHAPATVGFTQRSYSAKDVLDLLKTVFSTERFENRFVLVANYGHGKSHLALTLANFFSRPSNSEEVQIILSRLGLALNNPSQVAVYRDFKITKGEFLVVRLQGDAINDLQEGFVFALEKSLSEHASTRNLEIPLWTHAAEKWLKGLAGETQQRAEAFLSQENMDLPSLINSLRQEGMRELTMELFKHLNGIYPNFGREINLRDLIIWAVDEVCKPKGFGGLLVLFDEFSLFLRKYVESRSIGKLQELLNGISDRPGKSAFLAFSQQDIETIETYVHGPRREDVRKELERLPKDKRARLFSLMEGVLDAYLKQDDTAWETFQAQQPVKGALAQAREIVFKHFGKHYFDELHWNTDSFFSKVVKGCFPLHPLTTAILSVHPFESGASENPRTALQFVRESWSRLRKEPAQRLDGQPNFVYPVALADFFGEQLSKKWYAAYENALQTAPQALTEEQRKILQALFLQAAVNLKAQGGEQVELLQHISGLERETVKQVLKELASTRIIYSDPISKVSSLWPASTRPREVEEILQDAIQKVPIDQALMAHIISAFARIPLELPLSFGHASDWAPHQVALTAEMFNVQELQKLLQPYKIGSNGIEEGKRGLVVWLIAQNEQEKNFLRSNAQSTLDQALGNTATPLPVVIVLPKRPAPGLIAAARRVKALESLDHTARDNIGAMMYNQEKTMAQTAFITALNDLVGDVQNYADLPHHLLEYAVPAPYRPSIQALKNLSLKSVLAECYRQAYAYRVDFYVQYPVGGRGPNQLRNAVQNVVRGLLSDEIAGSLPTLKNKDVQYQLITLYLEQKWGLLSPQNHSIQPPKLRALKQSWDLLDSYFPPGCNEVRAKEVLIQLLNPPYGHDYNTLAILFAAWIGYYRHEITRFSLSGQIVSLNQLKDVFNDYKSLQEFFNRIIVLSPLAISRAKPDEMYEQVDAVMDRIRQGRAFSILEAEQSLALLEQALSYPRLSESKRQEIEELSRLLKKAYEDAILYDQKVSEWESRLERSGFDEVMNLQNILQQLPSVSVVQPARPSLSELQTKWERALQSTLDSFCAKYSNLDDLDAYKSHEERLTQARRRLSNYPVFASKVDDALENLKRRRDEIKQRESEKSIVELINNMTPLAGLSVLYEYQTQLTKLTNLSQQTEKLRQSKLAQIKSRIEQLVQLAQTLPEAVARADSLRTLREQKELLLRNLELVRDTPLYENFQNLQQRIEKLEEFFERLQALSSASLHMPADFDNFENNLITLRNEFSDWLSPVQLNILQTKQQEISEARQRKVAEAKQWLEGLRGQCMSSSAQYDKLLQQAQNPPAFLPSDFQPRLEQITNYLRKKIQQNRLFQIEKMFMELDIDARRVCLKRLTDLMKNHDG